MAVSQTPSRSLSLARQAAAIVSARVLGGGEYRASGASNWDEFGGDGWVRSGGITPLYYKVLVRLVSAPAVTVCLSSRGWTSNALGVGNSSSAVLASSCISIFFQLLF